MSFSLPAPDEWKKFFHSFFVCPIAVESIQNSHFLLDKMRVLPNGGERKAFYDTNEKTVIEKQGAKMSQPTSVPPIVNRMMKSILRSPIHGLVSKIVLLISFTGRKSGKTFTTPVSYSQFGNQVYVFTHGNWWKNLRNGATVSLRLRGREVQGIAEPVAEDTQAIAAQLAKHLRNVPSDAKYYGVTFDENKNPRTDQIAQAAQSVVMLRIQLC